MAFYYREEIRKILLEKDVGILKNLLESIATNGNKHDILFNAFVFADGDVSGLGKRFGMGCT